MKQKARILQLIFYKKRLMMFLNVCMYCQTNYQIVFSEKLAENFHCASFSNINKCAD